MSLSPELTPLDRRVLEAVKRQPRRVRDVAEQANKRRPGWDTVSDRDIEAILRGLEHLGHVTRTRNGWWRAT